jgi:hypothetical protein
MRGATDAHGSNREATVTKQTGLDGRHRDKNGEISKKHPAARPVPQKKAAWSSATEIGRRCGNYLATGNLI